MKHGDRLRIEGVPYLVYALHGDQVVLNRVRRQMSARLFSAWLRARRWRRPSVSATFLVDSKTKKTIDNHQMLAIGISSKRIERLHETLPLLKLPVGKEEPR